MLATFFTWPTKWGLISQSGPSFHATWCEPTGWPTKKYSISLRQSTNTADGLSCRNWAASLGVRCFIAARPTVRIGTLAQAGRTRYGRWFHRYNRAMQPDRSAQLEALLRQRILVMDGAMGTMIQGYGLGEADYRGTC